MDATYGIHNLLAIILGDLLMQFENYEMAEVTAQKIWQGGPQEDHQPVTLELLKDGVVITPPLEPEVTETAPGQFNYVFKGLIKYREDGTPFVYTVREAGAQSGKRVVSGRTYAVSQNGNVITNTYSPPPPQVTYPTVKVPLSVQKTLKNGTLKGGEFTFQLKDGSGQVIEEVTNDSQGKAVFSERTFSKEVTDYQYTISEVTGQDARVSYDSTVYKVHVTTRAGNGRLTADVSYEKNGVPYAGDLAFTNVRKAPGTGDNTMRLTLTMLLASLSLLTLSTLLVARKKRRSGR